MFGVIGAVDFTRLSENKGVSLPTPPIFSTEVRSRAARRNQGVAASVIAPHNIKIRLAIIASLPSFYTFHFYYYLCVGLPPLPLGGRWWCIGDPIGLRRACADGRRFAAGRAGAATARFLTVGRLGSIVGDAAAALLAGVITYTCLSLME